MNASTQTPSGRPETVLGLSDNTVSGSTSLTVQSQPNPDGTSFVTKELLDAKLGLMKAEMNSEFTAALAPLKTDLDRAPGWSGVFAVIGAMVTLVGLVLGVLAFAGDRFDGGMSASGALAADASNDAQRDKDQTKMIEDLSKKIDKLVLGQPK
jgi:hypothetical protein